jgi:hypothetical protein
MLDMHDERWSGLMGCHRLPFDPRPLIRELEITPYSAEIWGELAKNLCCEGHVGEASYAAVPQLVRISSGGEGEALPWQLLALVAGIELARTEEDSPLIPEWLGSEYVNAMDALALKCLRGMREIKSSPLVRGALGVLALWKGFRIYAAAFLEYSEDELSEFFISDRP